MLKSRKVNSSAGVTKKQRLQTIKQNCKDTHCFNGEPAFRIQRIISGNYCQEQRELQTVYMTAILGKLGLPPKSGLPRKIPADNRVIDKINCYKRRRRKIISSVFYEK